MFDESLLYVFGRTDVMTVIFLALQNIYKVHELNYTVLLRPLLRQGYEEQEGFEGHCFAYTTKPLVLSGSVCFGMQCLHCVALAKQWRCRGMIPSPENGVQMILQGVEYSFLFEYNE